MMKFILCLILFCGLACTTKEVSQKTSYLMPNQFLNSLDLSTYNFKVITSAGSTIHLYLQKNSALNPDKIAISIEKSWPVFSRMLLVPPLRIAVIDMDGPIGGGPIEKYIVALYSTQKMSPIFMKMVNQATGWSNQESTQHYIKKYYSHFSDPEQAYIDDIIIHELGHTIFGFGLTQASHAKSDWWFTFGLGLLYDRMVWESFYGTDSPLFGGAIAQWENRFAKIKQIDQRLVRPNEQADKKYELSRLQVYGHGKALIFLRQLRHIVGNSRFDAAVIDTIAHGGVLDYDLFIKKYFSDKSSSIYALEKKLQVR